MAISDIQRGAERIADAIRERRLRKQEKALQEIEISNRVKSAIDLAEKFGGKDIADKIAGLSDDIRTKEGAALLEDLIKGQIKSNLELQGYSGLAKRADVATKIAKAEELGLLPKGMAPKLDAETFTKTVASDQTMDTPNLGRLGSGPLGIKAQIGVMKTIEEQKAKDKLKLESKKQEEIQKAEKSAKGTFRFLQQFNRSYEELLKFDPEIGKEGFGGYLSRSAAKIATSLDELPETKALKIEILPMANAVAREIEGGRVTDQDRQIYADRFASAINHPTKTNIRLMSNSLVDLIDKGGNEKGIITNQLKALASTKTDIFNSVITQVLIEYPDLADDIFGEGFEVVE